MRFAGLTLRRRQDSAEGFVRYVPPAWAKLVEVVRPRRSHVEFSGEVCRRLGFRAEPSFRSSRCDLGTR